jgi:hypothetical protein
MGASAKPALVRAPATPTAARLEIDARVLRESFDKIPFGFSHNFHTLPVFAFDSLESLAAKFSSFPRDYFVAGSAPSPATKFYAVPNGGCTPVEALKRLDKGNCRVLLKRPENYDVRFRDLLETVFEQVLSELGRLDRGRIARLESAILISSGSTTTPVHFDPEIAFFSQIEGEKFYHIFPPCCAREADLERFYVRGRIDVAPVDLDRLDPQAEKVFRLLPGSGFHQPQNSPHWVRTGEARSVSYTFVFETEESRARGRIRAYNYGMRKVGLSPAPLGEHPRAESAKARAMFAALPAQFAGRVFNKIRRVVGGARMPS